MQAIKRALSSFAIASLAIVGGGQAYGGICEESTDRLNSFLVSDKLAGHDETGAEYIERALGPFLVPVQLPLADAISQFKLPALDPNDQRKLTDAGFDFASISSTNYLSEGPSRELLVDQRPGDPLCHYVALFSTASGSLKLTSQFNAAANGCFGGLLVIQSDQHLFPVITNIEQRWGFPSYQYRLGFIRNLAGLIEPENTYCEVTLTFTQKFFVDSWKPMSGATASKFELIKSAASVAIEKFANSTPREEGNFSRRNDNGSASNVWKLIKDGDVSKVSAWVRGDKRVGKTYITVEPNSASFPWIQYPTYYLSDLNDKTYLFAIGSSPVPDSSGDMPRFAIFSLESDAAIAIAAGTLRPEGTFVPPATHHSVQ